MTAKKIEVGKLTVDNHSEAECVSICQGLVSSAILDLSKAINEQNMGKAGIALSSLTIAVGVLNELDKKMTPQKEAQVLR